jgi:hypothetical protein
MVLPKCVKNCFHFRKSGIGPKSFRIIATRSDDPRLFEEVIPWTDHDTVIDKKIDDCVASFQNLYDLEKLNENT